MRNPYTGEPLGPIAQGKVRAYTKTLRKARRVIKRTKNPRRVVPATRVIRNAEHHIDVTLREEAKS